MAELCEELDYEHDIEADLQGIVELDSTSFHDDQEREMGMQLELDKDYNNLVGSDADNEEQVMFICSTLA